MMDYAKQLRDIEKLIDQGLFVQAVQTSGSTLEGLYKDLYRQVMDRLPTGERDQVLKVEQAKGGGKAISEYTLGQLAGLFREAQLVLKLERYLSLSLPFMKSFEPTYFVDLRNRVTHRGADITLDEARILYQQLRMLVKETGRLAAPVAAGAALMLKPWTQVARPHEDIVRGELEMSTYAAELWSVYRQDPNCPGVYLDPRAFFKATYPTAALRSLLQDVMGVLAGGRGDRVLQLRTPFGGGKTHTLIALYHLATGRAALAHDDDLAALPDPGRTSVAVLHGIALDPHVGRKVEGGPHLRTLWGELAWQLGVGRGGKQAGLAAYALVEAQDQARTAPGGDVLRQLLDGSPALLLLDEILVYVQKARAIPLYDSTLGRQTMVFLQTLTEVVRGLRQAAMVYSLQASVHEATGDEALLAELDHLVSRVDAKREPVSGDEVMRVVQRRLFADLGDDRVRQEVVRAYADLFRRLREGISQTDNERREAGREASIFEERLLASYPFHPDLLDLMYHRWGSLPSYQRTRGALQFLATIVHALWRHPAQAQPLIGPGDAPLHDPAVRGALFSQVGEREHYTAVLEADLIGSKARVQEVDRRVGQESPALQQLRVGTRLATAVFLYSFGARSGEDRGVLENELIGASLAPGLDRMVLAATLSDLREQLLYLHYTARRYRFETRPNLNRLIGDEALKYEADAVLKKMKSALEERLGSGRAAVAWPPDSNAIPDREPGFKVVYLNPEWANKTESGVEHDLRTWLENRGSAKREYLNALAFALPARQSADQGLGAARQLLAIESLLEQSKKFQFSDEQVEELKERRRKAVGEVDSATRVLYETVRLPIPDRQGDTAYRWEILDLRGQTSSTRELHTRVLEAMRNWVFDYVTPDRLLSLTRLGQARELGGPVVDFLACERVKDWFFSYLDFPKLIDIRGLQKCIAAGVKDRAFGYVVGPRLDDTGQLTVEDRRRVHFGDTLNPDEVDLGSGAYLLSADLASQLSQPPAMDRGTVMGRVWLDADQDGKRTDAEPGLSGVTVRFIQGNTEVGRSVTGQDGSYVSPPLPPGTTKVVLDPTPEYAATTAGFVEVPIARQAQTMADFGLQKKDQGTGSRHYRLRLKANKAQAFTVFRVLQNLSDKADRLTITFDISAEAKDRAGFDPVWLRNAIEEPLDEADITRE